MNSTRLTAAVDAVYLSPRRQPVAPYSGYLPRHCIPGCLHSTNIIAPIGAKFREGYALVANYGGQDANLDSLSHWVRPTPADPGGDFSTSFPTAEIGLWNLSNQQDPGTAGPRGLVEP